MKTMWTILAFGISVTLHATLLLFGDPTHSATIPVNQGHATLAIQLVASVASEAQLAPPPLPQTPVEIPQPIMEEPVEQPKVVEVEPMPLAAPVIESVTPMVPALTEQIAQPVHETKPVAEPVTPVIQQMVQEQSVKQPITEQAPPVPMSTPASVDANSDPQPQGVTTAAQLRDPIRPVYPMLSRRRGEEGTVMVQVQVTAQGQPRSVVITRSSGISRLDAAAIKACRSAHYLPAMKNGHATDSTFCFEVCFQLQSGS